MNLSEIIENRKLVNLGDRPRAVFVGDTHGDLEASKKVWDRFHQKVKNGQTYLVFLGDYVDRGSHSKENIDFLLEKKENYPDGVILLMGNHDAYHRRELRPADFWRSLNNEEYEHYKELSSLPWMATAEGLVATHGCLPFISDLEILNTSSEEIFEEENELDTPIWLSIAWGDINDTISGAQMDALTGRPQFGKETVLKHMQKHDWNVLIRAHQPGTQGWNFSKNVLTIFTSKAYVEMNRAQERSIAIVDIEDGVKSHEDVEVVGLDEI